MNQLSLIIITLSLFSCQTTGKGSETTGNKDGARTNTTLQSAAGTMKKGDTEQSGVVYRESTAFLTGDKAWVAKIFASWPAKLSRPRYSAPLSTLARSLQSFGGKPADPGSLQKVASVFGIATPWISQTYMVAANYADPYFVTWFRNTLLLYSGRQKVSHFGFAVVKGKGEDERVGILLFQKRKIKMDAFSQVVGVGKPLKISGKVDNDVTKLELLMTLPGGKVKRRKVSLLGAGVFAHAEYFCTKEKKGHYSVELMGEDGHGPVVLALFPVACGSADHLRKVRVTMKKPTVDMAASKAAREAFDLVNAYRKKNKMKAYKWSVKLAAVATAHSDEMCKFKSIYHLSPITGAPDKRVKRAGIKTDLVAENVAVASSPESIVSSWIMSEGHRLNMVLKDGVYGAVGVCKASINKSIHYYATLVVTGKIR